MANLTETPTWESGVYRIELTDPVMGGEDGIDNIQAKQLGNRTLYLKGAIEQEVQDRIDALSGFNDTIEEMSIAMAVVFGG